MESISGNINTITSNINTISSKVNTISGNINTISGNINTLSGRINNNNNLGNAITLSGDVANGYTITIGDGLSKVYINGNLYYNNDLLFKKASSDGNQIGVQEFINQL